MNLKADYPSGLQYSNSPDSSTTSYSLLQLYSCSKDLKPKNAIKILSYIAIVTIVDSVTVSAPHELVKNFYCFEKQTFFGYDRCTWNYTVDDIQIRSAFFTWRRDTKPWNQKPILPPTSTSVDISSIGTVFEDHLTVGINVTLQNEEYVVFARNFTDVWTAQLPPFSKLRGTSLNSSCICLSWRFNEYDQYDKNLMVNCTSSKGILEILAHGYALQTQHFTIQSTQNVTVCRLRPWTSYNCSASTRLIVTSYRPRPKCSWWSRETITIVTTNKDVPGISPDVTSGLYTWEHTESCDTANHTEFVWIYWKPIDPWYHNGEMNGTVISYNTSEGERVVYVNKSRSSVEIDLQSNQSYKVNIRAVNDVGESVHPSTLIISPPLKYTPQLIVEMENTELSADTSVRYLEWSPPSPHRQLDGDQTTVFYAEKLPSGQVENAQLCKPGSIGPVDWRTVYSTVNKTTLFVGDKPYCYAVSFGNTNRSTALNWTACIYIKGKVPKAPENVRIRKISNTNNSGLLVEWTRIRCSTGQPFIKWYEIGKCNNTLHCEEILRLPSNISSVILTNQSSIAGHMISVRAVTRFGVHGNWSEPVSVPQGGTNKHNDGLSGDQLAGIIAGVLMPTIILLAVCLIVAVRKYSKHLHNLKVETIEIRPGPAISVRMSDHIEPESSNDWEFDDVSPTYNPRYPIAPEPKISRVGSEPFTSGRAILHDAHVNNSISEYHVVSQAENNDLESLDNMIEVSRTSSNNRTHSTDKLADNKSTTDKTTKDIITTVIQPTGYVTLTQVTQLSTDDESNSDKQDKSTLSSASNKDDSSESTDNYVFATSIIKSEKVNKAKRTLNECQVEKTEIREGVNLKSANRVDQYSTDEDNDSEHFAQMSCKARNKETDLGTYVDPTSAVGSSIRLTERITQTQIVLGDSGPMHEIDLHGGYIENSVANQHMDTNAFRVKEKTAFSMKDINHIGDKVEPQTDLIMDEKSLMEGYIDPATALNLLVINSSSEEREKSSLSDKSKDAKECLRNSQQNPINTHEICYVDQISNVIPFDNTNTSSEAKHIKEFQNIVESGDSSETVGDRVSNTPLNASISHLKSTEKFGNHTGDIHVESRGKREIIDKRGVSSETPCEVVDNTRLDGYITQTDAAELFGNRAVILENNENISSGEITEQITAVGETNERLSDKNSTTTLTERPHSNTLGYVDSNFIK